MNRMASTGGRTLGVVVAVANTLSACFRLGRYRIPLPRPRTLLLPLVGVILMMAVFGGAAQASVSSGRGQIGYTTTQCGNDWSYTMGHSFNAKAVVRQEFTGQWVAARFRWWDGAGWHVGGWAQTNNPGWSYDGVLFTQTFPNLVGHVAYLYVDYGWYDANGWRVGGEMITDYTTIFGVHMSYCAI